MSKQVKKRESVKITLDQFSRLANKLNLQDKSLIFFLIQGEFDRMSDSELNEIMKQYNQIELNIRIDNINTLDIERLKKIPNVDLHYKDSKFNEKNLETIIEIKKRLGILTQGIEKTDTDIEKFARIYKRLAMNITYDYRTAYIYYMKKNGKACENNEIEKINDSQTLNGLITQTTVCAGYARILQCALESVGVECQYMYGKTNKEPHAWNLVRINKKWYNTDLTLDIDDILRGYMVPRYCLRSDKAFINHKRSFKSGHKCNKDYDRDELANFFNGRWEASDFMNIPKKRSFGEKIKDTFKRWKDKVFKKADAMLPNSINDSMDVDKGKKLQSWDLKNWGEDNLKSVESNKDGKRTHSEIEKER